MMAPGRSDGRIGLAEAAQQALARHRARTRWLLVAPALVTIVTCGLMPLFIVLAYSWLKPAEFAGVVWEFRPDAWINLVFERDIFTDELLPNWSYYTIIVRSILMALMTTALTLILGFPTAYFIATRAPSQRNLWLFVITIPFWTNQLIRIYSIMTIVRDEGYLNYLMIWLGLIDRPAQMLFTNGAVAFGLVYTYLPFMVLPLYASLEKMDFRLVEAGYDLYATRWRVLGRVIIPLVKPGIVAGCILVFIPAIGAYVIPNILGGGNKMMLGNLIAQQFGTARNWPQGSALAVALVVIVMLALIVYVRKSAPGATQR
jgi:spermidine/putrescine transport system permease protein